MAWIHVNYLWIIVMFLSAVWTLISHGTHSLQSTFLQIYFQQKNKLIYIMDGLKMSAFSFWSELFL